MKYFLNSRLLKWENLVIENLPFPFAAIGKSIGVLCVFDNINDFVAMFPNENPLILESVEKENHETDTSG